MFDELSKDTPVSSSLSSTSSTPSSTSSKSTTTSNTVAAPTKIEDKGEQISINADGHHVLPHPFTFWYLKKVKSSSASYEDNMKKLKTCTTIEEFWHIYSHLARPNELPPSIDYHFFREGIVPLWEDAANQKGGKWVVRMKKGLGNRCWEDILLAVLGDQFGLRDEICGVVMQCKLQEDVLSIWNRNASDRNIRLRIRDVLKEALSIPFNHLLEYKAHDQSIRNTLKNNR